MNWAGQIKNHRLWMLGGVVLGAVFLSVALRSIDPREIGHALAHVEADCAALAVISSLAFMGLKTWRWHAIMSGFYSQGIASLLRPVYSGTAVNLVVPHVGEIVRSAMVNRSHRLPLGMLLTSIAVERVFDLCAVLSLLGLFAVLNGSVPPLLAAAGYLAALLVSGVAGAGLCIFFKQDACARLGARLLNALPQKLRAPVQTVAARGIEGMQVIGNPRRLFGVFVLSVLQWLSVVLGILASVRAVGAVPAAVSALAVLVLLVVGTVLPTAPAYLGTTQLGFTMGLALFGVDEQRAFAASLVYTIFVVMPMMIIGLVYLYRVEPSVPA